MKIVFGIFLCIAIVSTLRVSYKIAWNRVMANEKSLDKATLFLMQGRFNQSLAQFEHSITINPRQKLAWSGKGLCLLYLGRFDEALKSYNQAMKIDPSFAPAWKGKGLTLETMGRYEEAVQCYNNVLRYYPQNKNVIASRDSCLKMIMEAP